VLGETGQAGGVGHASSSEAENAIVAGQLALSAETPLDPEQSGVEREEDESELLKQIGPVIETSQMFHLVQKYLFELLRRESCR
jgi:hypothetical protein